MLFNSKMTVTATAEYDNTAGAWKAKVICEDFVNGKSFRKSEGEYVIDNMCDEFVLPAAVLMENGIDTDFLLGE